MAAGRPPHDVGLRPVLADQVLRCAAGRRGGGRSGSVGAGGAGAGCWLAAGVRPGPQPPQSGGTPRPPGDTDSSPSRRGGTRRGPGPRRRAGRRRAPVPRAWRWSGGARPDAGAPRRRAGGERPTRTWPSGDPLLEAEQEEEPGFPSGREPWSPRPNNQTSLAELLPFVQGTDPPFFGGPA